MIRINDKRFLLLGLTIIIASVFLGTFFASRYKSLNVSAVAAGACTCSDSKGNPVAGSCSGSSCNCGSNEQRNNKCGESAPGPAENNTNENSCETPLSGRTWCSGIDLNNTSYGFCTDNANSHTNCNMIAASMGYVIKTGGGHAGSNGGWYCRVGVKNYTSGPCVYNNSIRSISEVPTCFCGVIQIDGTGDNAGTYMSSCGCDNNDQEPNPTPNPTPAVTPTSTPVNTPTSTPMTTPTNNPTPTNTPTSTPTPTGVPNSCNGTCGSNTNCQGGLFCLLGSGQTSGYCRNPECAQEADCKCKSTSTPPAVLGQTAPPALPKTGGSVVSQISLVGIAALGFFLFKRFKLN